MPRELPTADEVRREMTVTGWSIARPVVRAVLGAYRRLLKRRRAKREA